MTATRKSIVTAVLLPACCGLGMSANRADADGGFLAPYWNDIWEPSQSAVILHDVETGVEDLILGVSFEGDSREFGWIVPVPSLPALNTADPELFSDCARLTQPLYRDRGEGWGCGEATDRDVLAPGLDGNVEIYGEETVGIYQTLTLGADDAGALADSLTSWGYLHDANRAKLEEALQYYVDRSWYFVAMRVDSASVVNTNYDGYWFGFLDPIRLQFESAEPIYPLRISAISADDPSQILLYVCTSHRVTSPGMRTEYANNLDAKEFTSIKERYSALGELLDGPCFLTKLRGGFASEEMTEDLILSPADSNDEFRPIRYSGFPPGDLILLGAIGVGFVSLAQRRRRES